MELTIQEVAERLNMPIETVQRWIRQGKIPMQSNRGRYAIRSEMLERWADEYKMKIHLPQAAQAQQVEPQFDGILAAMRRGGVFHNLKADSKMTCLQMAVECIPGLNPNERSVIFERLIDRERLSSTGIGHGIALPHPRVNPVTGLLQPQITTCFLSRAVGFEAIDDQPVSVLMILITISTKLHLSLLSKLSFYLRDISFRDFLLGAPAAEALLSRVDAMESKTR